MHLRSLIGCLQLQVIFHKRATNHRSLLRKVTYEDKASYDSTPLHTACAVNTSLYTFTYSTFDILCSIFDIRYSMFYISYFMLKMHIQMVGETIETFLSLSRARARARFLPFSLSPSLSHTRTHTHTHTHTR